MMNRKNLSYVGEAIMDGAAIAVAVLCLSILLYGLVHETAHACAGMLCGVEPVSYKPFPGVNQDGSLRLPMVEWGQQAMMAWKWQIIVAAPYMIDCVLCIAVALWMASLRSMRLRQCMGRWVHMFWAFPLFDVLANLVQAGSPGNDFGQMAWGTWAAIAMAAALVLWVVVVTSDRRRQWTPGMGSWAECIDEQGVRQRRLVYPCPGAHDPRP
jgi:hypothetical protein